MNAVVLSIPGGEHLARALAHELGVELGALEVRNFPDGETYVRIDSPIAGRDVVIAASLDRPNPKLAPLLYVARTARSLLAASVGLAVPYLAYLRQDRQFRPGEGVTSAFFAEFVSNLADWLITVDPHLHRIGKLGDIYPIRAIALHAAPLIGAWLLENVSKPLIIGPDEESRQWVAAVADAANSPHVVLQKIRRGDRAVEVSVPDIERFDNYTPVLVDDIISTGRTMIEAVRHVRQGVPQPPYCIGVHAIFAGTAYEELLAAGSADVVTCNSIEHPSNRIDVVPQVASAVRALIASRSYAPPRINHR